MVNYKDLGLVNTREMFARAVKGGYAIPAFNFNNMEQLQAIIKAAVAEKSPVILQVSKGAREYANPTLLWLTLRSSVASILKSASTSTTVTASKPARAALTRASAR